MNHKETLNDIREHPEKHKHRDLNELNACAFIDDALDLSVIEAHGGLHGYNGGVACDVSSGPCSCGAWH